MKTINNRWWLILLSGLGGLLLIWWFWGQLGGTKVPAVSTRAGEMTAAEPLTIIALGDSLTAGYGLPVHESYPAQLEAALQSEGFRVKVINSGVSGETTRGSLERAAFIRDQNPDIVLLGIGGNDALRLLPIAETKKNLEQIILTLQTGDNPPVIILLRMQAPLTAGLGYKQEFDALYEDLADRYELTLVPFLTSEVFLKRENKLADGIHLNAKGYKFVVEEYIMPTLREILEEGSE